MEKVKFKGITGSDIKYIAILAMLIDHVAWAFIPIDTAAAQIMHAIGRITAPVMCFFISEGFHYTKSFKKYMTRMCVFAFISHFAFNYYFSGNPFVGGTESMITTLALCLVAVWTVNNEKLGNHVKLIILLCVTMLSQNCDWGAKAVLFTLAFEFARGDKKRQLVTYAVVCFITNILPNMLTLIKGQPDLFMTQIYNFGVLLPIPLLYLYNGTKGGSKATKWIFYIFYPAHLIILGYISNNY